MPGVWFCLKESLNCESSKSTDVHGLKRSHNENKIRRRKLCNLSSGCSRSLSNLRDVTIAYGNNKSFRYPTISSPRSMESNDLLNPIKYDAIINHSNRYQLKLSGPNGFCRAHHEGNHRRSVSTMSSKSPLRGNFGYSPKSARASFGMEFHGFGGVICRKCCEKFKDLDAFESHHLSNHAVTELVEGDSSRKIVEMICRKSFSRSNSTYERISRVLKVHNMQKTVAAFEDYREIVKIKASKLNKKHPRCLADGNELLRFHGTSISCCLGLNGSSGLCVSGQCGVCRILRHGFCTSKESNGCVGVFTASTSSRALKSIEIDRENKNLQRVLILCRVIAGRVHRPLENLGEISGLSVFDSVAGKLDQHSNIEELYLLSPRALLPCFVVIFKY